MNWMLGSFSGSGEERALRYYAVAGTLALGLAAGCWFGIAEPALLRRENDGAARLRLSDVRTKVEQSRQTLIAADQLLRNTQAQLARYDHPCWSELDRSKRLEWLYTIARSQGMELDAVEPGEAVIAGGRRGIPLRLTGRGSFPAVVATLRSVRASIPDFLLRMADFNTSGTSNTDALTVTMELIWFPVAEASAPPSREHVSVSSR